MTQSSPKLPRQPPWEGGADAEAVTFGTWLRRQREMREVPLREIAEVTKISIRYLEALEQDRFDVLPAPVFARGFLREYSKYVGLDPDEVVNSYLTACVVPEEEAASDTERRPWRSYEWASGLLLALAVVGVLALIALLFYFSRWRRESLPIEQPPIAAPAIPQALPPPPVPAVPAGDESLVVTMDFTEDCWVEAVVDGERRLSELHVQGESMRLEAQEAVRLTLGNPAGVRLEVNGRPYPLDVARDRVARDIDIVRPEPAAGATP